MGKRKKKTQSAEQLEDKPWCFYCDREFENEKVLIQHQKQRHFKCPICNKRLVSVTGLSTHMERVHREKITKVPNAKDGRHSFEYEIFGMHGIPEEIILEHQGYSPEEVEKMKKRRLEEESGVTSSSSSIMAPANNVTSAIPSLAPTTIAGTTSTTTTTTTSGTPASATPSAPTTTYSARAVISAPPVHTSRSTYPTPQIPPPPAQSMVYGYPPQPHFPYPGIPPPFLGVPPPPYPSTPGPYGAIPPPHPAYSMPMSSYAPYNPSSATSHQSTPSITSSPNTVTNSPPLIPPPLSNQQVPNEKLTEAANLSKSSSPVSAPDLKTSPPPPPPLSLSDSNTKVSTTALPLAVVTETTNAADTVGTIAKKEGSTKDEGQCLIYDDDEVSMEEKRAKLEKYTKPIQQN